MTIHAGKEKIYCNENIKKGSWADWGPGKVFPEESIFEETSVE